MRTERELRQWLEKRKITPPRVTQHELALPHSNENTDEEVEETVKRLIGLTLAQSLSLDALLTSLELARQYSLDIPVTEVLTSSALLATVSLLMSTSDRLRTLTCISPPCLPTMLSEAILEELLPNTDAFIEEALTLVFEF